MAEPPVVVILSLVIRLLLPGPALRTSDRFPLSVACIAGDLRARNGLASRPTSVASRSAAPRAAASLRHQHTRTDAECRGRLARVTSLLKEKFEGVMRSSLRRALRQARR
jgi:hypothetical protein